MLFDTVTGPGVIALKFAGIVVFSEIVVPPKKNGLVAVIVPPALTLPVKFSESEDPPPPTITQALLKYTLRSP